jgi:hypothetical protein
VSAHSVNIYIKIIIKNKMAQLNEITRMQQLAGLINESQLNEDILEIKQMSKQLYSFLKQKGLSPQLTTKITKPLNANNPKGSTITTTKKEIGKFDNAVQIVVDEGYPDRAVVAITPSSVAKVLVGGGDDWTHKARQKFGDDWGSWYKNQEIVNYVNKLGEELSKQVKEKYPNMLYKFEPYSDFFYKMYFGYGQTKKGGQLNPNQRPNAPKPASPTPQQESIEQAVNEALAKFRKKEQTNEGFFSKLFGGNKSKEKKEVIHVFWELSQGAMIDTGVYLNNDSEGKKIFDEWAYNLKLTRDNASRSNNPNQPFSGCIRGQRPAATDVFITSKVEPYEEGMKVYTSYSGDVCGPAY